MIKSISLISVMILIVPSMIVGFVPKNQSSQKKLHISSDKRKETSLHLYKSAKEAIAEAKMICFEEGPNSERCKVAWDIVEELEAADSHVRSADVQANELSYSPLVDSLEILSAKIERKMDELKNLSTTLAEYGAGAEVERLIYASDEMKQVLADARAATDQYRQ